MQIKKRLRLAFGNTEAATGVLCILYKYIVIFFYMIRVQTYRKSFLYFSAEIKKACEYRFRHSQADCAEYTKFRKNILYKGVQVHSPSKNIYGSAFLILDKIYARKWLCQAVCGHNIFFV